MTKMVKQGQNPVDQDEVIDFDGVIENDGEPLVALPDGDEVTLTVKEVTKGRNKAGDKPQVTIKWAAVSNNGHGRTTITDYITMTRKSEWKLCELFVALGIRKHGEALALRWDIEGMEALATVTVEKYTNKDGDEKEGNKIKHYLESEQVPDGGEGGADFGG